MICQASARPLAIVIIVLGTASGERPPLITKYPFADRSKPHFAHRMRIHTIAAGRSAAAGARLGPAVLSPQDSRRAFYIHASVRRLQCPGYQGSSPRRSAARQGSVQIPQRRRRRWLRAAPLTASAWLRSPSQLGRSSGQSCMTTPQAPRRPRRSIRRDRTGLSGRTFQIQLRILG